MTAILKKRVSVRAMQTRWKRDLARLEKLFGDYDENDFTDGAEMQRNLGTALTYANSFLASTR
jgi:hypothetical protein